MKKTGITLSIGMMILGLVSMHLTYIVSQNTLAYETSNTELSEIDLIDFAYDNIESKLLDIIVSCAGIELSQEENWVEIKETLPNNKNPGEELTAYKKFAEGYGEEVIVRDLGKDQRSFRIIPGEIMYTHSGDEKIVINPEKVLFKEYELELIISGEYIETMLEEYDANSGETIMVKVKVRECLECDENYFYEKRIDLQGIKKFTIKSMDGNALKESEVRFLPGATMEIKTSSEIDYEAKIVFPEEIIPFIRTSKGEITVVKGEEKRKE